MSLYSGTAVPLSSGSLLLRRSPTTRLPRDRMAMRGARKRVRDGERAMTFLRVSSG